MVALGSVLGVILSRIGKKGDQEQQAVTDQFRRMLEENQYLTTSLTQARADISQVRQGWEDRWQRQMDRCRTITDTLVNALATNTPATTNSALQKLDDHRAHDHDETGR
jgi:hypothetical protein